MNTIGTSLLGVGLLGGVLYLVNKVRYELHEDALCVVYGRVCVRRVPYENISAVERGTAFFNEHYNRISRDPNITLKLKRGIIAPNLVINPPQTDEFITRLRARLAHA